MAANNNINDSYNRCIAELRARYRGRGVALNAHTDAMTQINAEKNTRDAAPESYMLFDARSGISDSFRSGEYKGSKYMTSEDFVRYFRTRRPYYSPAAVRKAAQPEVARRSMTPGAGRKNGAGSGVVPSESGSKEDHLKIKTAVTEFINKWFPIESKEGRTEGTRFRFPAAACGTLAAFALSLGLIVSGSVLIGNASGELGTLNSEITKLEAKQSELQGELDLKYDMKSIEEDAAALGMIKSEYADGKYLSTGSEEKIEIYENEEKNIGFAAILNAFGIRLGD